MTWKSSHPDIISVNAEGVLTIHRITNDANLVVKVTNSGCSFYNDVSTREEPDPSKQSTAVDNLTISDIGETTLTASAKLVEATGQIIEYGISENGQLPKVWQKNGVFSDLRPWTEYHVFARSVADDKHETGTAINVLTQTGDKTAPSVKIALGNASWEHNHDNDAFEIFVKNKVSVTLTAFDDASGLDTLDYALADQGADHHDLSTLQWQRIENGAVIDLRASWAGYLYLKAVDKAQNETLLRSPGVVVYQDSSQTVVSTYTKNEENNLELYLEMHGNAVKRIVSHNPQEVELNDSEAVLSTNQITLTKEYLNALTEGAYTFTVEYEPLGIDYVESEGNEAPTLTTINLTVEKALQKTLRFESTTLTKTNGDAAFVPVYTEGKSGGVRQWRSNKPEIAAVHADTGEITIHNSGTVIITVTQKGDDFYQDGSAAMVIFINEAPLPIKEDSQEEAVEIPLSAVEENPQIDSIVQAIVALSETKTMDHAFADSVAEITNHLKQIPYQEGMDLPQAAKDKLKRMQDQASAVNHRSKTVTVVGLDWNVRLEVEQVPEYKVEYNAFDQSLAEHVVVALFDIRLWDTLTNEKYKFTMGETITIAIDDVNLEDKTDLLIVHQKHDGELEYLEAMCQHGMITFLATSLSLYGVVVKDSPALELPVAPQIIVQETTPPNTKERNSLMIGTGVTMFLVWLAMKRKAKHKRIQDHV